MDDSVPHHVDGDQLQLTVFHELVHLVAENGKHRDQDANNMFRDVVGWKWEYNSVTETEKPIRRGTVPSPFCSGRIDHWEDIAVTGEADFAGGEEAQKLDDARKLALSGLWTRRRSRDQGPMFVRSTELPLPAPGDKIGLLREVPVALASQYFYQAR